MSDSQWGTCCACGQAEHVTNLVTLPHRSPYGYGWGCFQCNLPMDGAIALVCDDCVEAGTPIREFVKGMPHNGERAPIEELTEPFDHDISRHPEMEVPTVDAEDWGDEPVVLYDPVDGPIRDSQLRAICEQVAAEADTPNYLPPYWKYEASGHLQPAMEAFVYHWAHPDRYPAPTEQQMGLVLQYFKLYIHAPCWEDDPEAPGALNTLKAEVDGLRTFADCDRWLKQCLTLGIDPL